MTRSIKVGIIGLGEVAQTIHLPVLTSLADRFEIAALCDVSPGLVELLGDRYGVAPDHRTRDAAALAALPDLDAVMVLSSDEYHADHAVTALRHGKHVFIEKPLCLAPADAERIIAARDAAGTQVMVGYMRRFAPAFVQAAAEIAELRPILYVRVRDIIGQNRLIIDQTSVVHRFSDIPSHLAGERATLAQRQVTAAIGDAPPDLVTAYRLLCGLGSHDLSAMRELIGLPERVAGATQWHGGRFLTALFAYRDFGVTFEMGVDRQRRFDAHIEIYGETASLRVQYDTPYVRHLPTTVVARRTVGETYTESILRPTFEDAFTRELRHFADVIAGETTPKTPPEDSIADLRLFHEIIAALRQ